MSFNISVPKSAKADFAAAVDAAPESPQQTTEHGRALVSAVKAAAKQLAEQFDGELPIGGSASGHACEEGDPGTDSAYVSVFETKA